MKQIILLTIFVLSFCYTNFGQAIKCETQPDLVYEYPNSTNSSEKHTMQAFMVMLEESPNCRGGIRLKAKKNEEIFRQYRKIQKSFLFLRLPIEKIKFAIIQNNQEEKVEFWLTPQKTEIPNCEECIIIRAKDFPKIEELFKPKTKKRKN